MLKLMVEETMPNETRSIEVAVDIAAPTDAVWKALTDPAELVRWFPLQSAVTPGAGGTMKWAWDDKWAWESRIDIWEPYQRLRLVQDEQRPFDVDGGVLAPGEGEVAATHMVMDFTLETVAGQTRLRLVHSGFGRGAAWDDEIDGVRVGWNHELRGLAFYLERHRGKQRHSANAYLTRSESQETVWQKLLSAFRLSPVPPVAGQPYRLEVSTGDRFDGIVRHHVPNRDLTGTVRALADGILRLGTHRAAGKTGIVVSIATWDARHAPAVAALGERTQKLLEGMFDAP